MGYDTNVSHVEVYVLSVVRWWEKTSDHDDTVLLPFPTVQAAMRVLIPQLRGVHASIVARVSEFRCRPSRDIFTFFFFDGKNYNANSQNHRRQKPLPTT